MATLFRLIGRGTRDPLTTCYASECFPDIASREDELIRGHLRDNSGYSYSIQLRRAGSKVWTTAERRHRSEPIQRTTCPGCGGNGPYYAVAICPTCGNDGLD